MWTTFVCVCMLWWLSCVQLFATPRTPASSVHGISEARLLDGLPFPTPGDLPNPEIESTVSCNGKWIPYC